MAATAAAAAAAPAGPPAHNFGPIDDELRRLVKAFAASYYAMHARTCAEQGFASNWDAPIDADADVEGACRQLLANMSVTARVAQQMGCSRPHDSGLALLEAVLARSMLAFEVHRCHPELKETGAANPRKMLRTLLHMLDSGSYEWIHLMPAEFFPSTDLGMKCAYALANITIGRKGSGGSRAGPQPPNCPVS